MHFFSFLTQRVFNSVSTKIIFYLVPSCVNLTEYKDYITISNRKTKRYVPIAHCDYLKT